MTWDIAALRSVRAVAVDVDGTIAGPDNLVNARTAEAIRGVLDLGLPVFLLTGRSRSSVLALAQDLGIRNSVAAANGSIVFDPVRDLDLRTIPMGDADVGAVIGLSRSIGLGLTWWTRDAMWVEELGDMADELARLNQVPVQRGSIHGIESGQVTKMMLHGTPDALDRASGEILGRLPRAARSMDIFFEFVDDRADKWAALQHLLGTAISPEAVMGLGDGGNDVPWLSRVGYPVAMGNAREEVRAVARSTTSHHGEDGAAEALERLVRALS